MASSYAHVPKTHQHSKKKFAESSSKTIVGLQKTEVKLKKMVDSLERQQNTAVNNIANHQQAMKMSWRRLEEKRSTSPLMTRQERKQKEEATNGKRGLLLQSNTRLYVKGTPQVYNVDAGSSEVIQVRPATADDSVLGRVTPSTTRGYLIQNKSFLGPPPTQLTRAQTSPYISSPHNFRKTIPSKEANEPASSEGGSDTQLSSSQDAMKSSSQPMLIKSSAINNKETLLKASTMMDMRSNSSGPRGFKNFYSERPRSQTHTTLPISSLVTKQMESTEDSNDADDEEQGEDEVEASSSMPSLAEQFEQIKNCRYIRHSRHYHPEAAARDDDDD